METLVYHEEVKDKLLPNSDIDAYLRMIIRLGVIKEKIIDLISDGDIEKILNCVSRESKTINEISNLCNINIRTCYRKVNMLTEFGWLNYTTPNQLNKRFILNKFDRFYLYREGEYQLPIQILNKYYSANSKKIKVIKILSILSRKYLEQREVSENCNINRRTCYRLLIELIEARLVNVIQTNNLNGNKKKYYYSKLVEFYYLRRGFKIIPIIDIIIEDSKLLEKICYSK